MLISLAASAAPRLSEQGREILPFGDSMLKAVLGYAVVFVGLVLLMLVIMIVGKIMVAGAKKSKKAEAAPAPAVTDEVKKLAPGSAGDVKLYDTDPRDAAMIMAIVAHKLQKPLNELKFVSIKEVK